MTDAREPTTPEEAAFEVGIKFGSLYHQFAGTPVSPDSADSLARAMAEAIENQPHCTECRVEIDTEALREHIAAGSASYTELTGTFLTVEIDVSYEGCNVTAAMEMDDGYPLMQLTNVSE